MTPPSLSPPAAGCNTVWPHPHTALHPMRVSLLYDIQLHRASDRLYRRRVLQRGNVACLLAQIRRTNDAPHDLGVARAGEIGCEADLLRQKRLAELCAYRLPDRHADL